MKKETEELLRKERIRKRKLLEVQAVLASYREKFNPDTKVIKDLEAEVARLSVVS